MANKKISDLTAKGANLEATDLFEIAEDAGGGTYVAKSITGAEIIAAGTDTNFANSALTFTANRTHDLAGYKATLDNAELKVIADADTSGDIPFEVTQADGTTSILKVNGDGVVFSRGRGNIDTNTAFGEDVFKTGITGLYNVGFGDTILTAITSGESNVGIGRNNLNANTTGGFNIAIGNTVLNKVTTASNNVAIGTLALAENLTGSSNTAVGGQALGNTTGSNNTAVGFNSLRVNTSGANNISIGHGSSYNNTTGSNNTIVGVDCMVGNTTGQNNTGIGAYIENSNNSDCILIGRGATSNGNNQLVVGSAGTTVGNVEDIGTFTATKKMTIKLNGVDYYIQLDPVV